MEGAGIKMRIKDYSRENFATPSPILDNVNTGCLQRIADACELMAKNHAELERERDCYLNLWKDTQAERDAAERSNRALRGQITKLRAELAALKAREQR
jgi:hypothetical protein